MFNHLHIEFQGITAPQKVQQLAKMVADKVERQAPADASLKLVFQKTKGAVKASFKIASRAGVFFADTLSNTPEEGLARLEKKISRQLAKWKKSRQLVLPE